MDKWTSSRSYPATSHRYMYVEDNPINNIDPTGYFTLPEVTQATALRLSLRTANLARRFPNVARASAKSIKTIVLMSMQVNMIYLIIDDTIPIMLKTLAFKNLQLYRKRIKAMAPSTILKNVAASSLAILFRTLAGSYASKFAQFPGVTIKGNGFPDFRKALYRGAYLNTVVIPNYRGTRSKDFTAANRLAGITVNRLKPKGFTWHHHEAIGVMQLVDTPSHKAIDPHMGGVFYHRIWRPSDYKRK